MVLERPGTFHAIPGISSCHLTLSDSLHNFSSRWHLEASTILKKLVLVVYNSVTSHLCLALQFLELLFCPDHQTPVFLAVFSSTFSEWGCLALTNSSPRSQHSVQFSLPVVSNSLRPHGLQHARPSCPSPTPGVYSNSCPLSRWGHSTISSCVVPFSSRLQSFPASGSFQMSRFFTSGGQSVGVAASASVLPINIQDWFPLGWTGWISLQSKGLSRVFSNTTVQKHQFFGAQLSL